MSTSSDDRLLQRGDVPGWALWQLNLRTPESQPPSLEAPNVELVHLRDVDAEELVTIQAALQLVGEMNGQHLIGPFIRSANRVRAVIEHVREAPSARSSDIEVQLELGMALDEWLVSTNSFRRRTERDVRRCLGAAGAAAAEARFQDMYDNNVDFRLVWEWRNAAQHTINPGQITRLTASRREPDARWILVGDRARSTGFSWPPHVLAHMTPDLDGIALMERVVDACNTVGCQIMVDNEVALDGAADLLWAVFAEQQDDRPGGRVLARITPGQAEAQWDWIPIRWDLPTHLLLQLEKSRVHLGLPRKRPELDLGDEAAENRPDLS